jgi:hypothetical protein
VTHGRKFRDACRVVMQKAERNTPLLRPRLGWEDNINCIIKK